MLSHWEIHVWSKRSAINNGVNQDIWSLNFPCDYPKLRTVFQSKVLYTMPLFSLFWKFKPTPPIAWKMVSIVYSPTFEANLIPCSSWRHSTSQEDRIFSLTIPDLMALYKAFSFHYVPLVCTRPLCVWSGSTCVCTCMLSLFSCVWLFATLWTVACQAPLSVGLSYLTSKKNESLIFVFS